MLGHWIRNAALVLFALIAAGSAGVPASGDEQIERDGDALPSGAESRLGSARLRHFGLLTSQNMFCFRPDSQVLTSWTGRTLKTWRVDDGSLLWASEESYPIVTVAYSSDSRQMAVAVEKKGVHLRDATTGNSVRKFGGDENYKHLAFAPGGEWIATGRSTPATIHVWDSATGRRIAELTRPEPTLTQLVPSRGGKSLIASLSGKGAVTLSRWDTATWQHQLDFSHPGLTFHHKISDDGRWFVGRRQRENDAYGLWDVEESRLVGQIPTSATTIDLAGGNLMVASGLTPKSELHSTIWDLANQRRVGEVAYSRWLGIKPRLSPDGKTLAAVKTQSVICLWDVATGKRRFTDQGHDDSVSHLEFTRDGQRLVSHATGPTGDELIVWDLNERRPIQRIARASGPLALLPSDHEVVVQVGPRSDIGGASDVIGAIGRPMRYDLAAGRSSEVEFAQPDVAELKAGERHRYQWFQVARESNRLIGVAPIQKKPTETVGYRITHWDLASGRQLSDELVRRDGDVTWIDPTATHGLRLVREYRPASAELQKVGIRQQFSARVEQVDLRSGRIDLKYDVVDSQRVDMAVARDGKTAAIAYGVHPNGTAWPPTEHGIEILNWPEATKRATLRLENPGPNDPQRMFFSDDGRILVVTRNSQRIELYETATGKRLDSDWRHEGNCTSVAFHPDGNMIAIGHADGQILFWRIRR